MTIEYLEIKFTTNTQKSSQGRFSVPVKVCELLRLGPGDEIRLMIERANGEILPPIIHCLTSGTEVSIPEEIADLESHERITVTVSRP